MLAAPSGELPDLTAVISPQEIEAWLGRQGFTFDQLVARDNRPLMVEARRIVARFLRQRGWSYPAIGRYLQRDHTTVMSLLGARPRSGGITNGH